MAPRKTPTGGGASGGGGGRGGGAASAAKAGGGGANARLPGPAHAAYVRSLADALIASTYKATSANTAVATCRHVAAPVHRAAQRE